MLCLITTFNAVNQAMTQIEIKAHQKHANKNSTSRNDYRLSWAFMIRPLFVKRKFKRY